MGGHGALTLYLLNRGQFRSASAFAPITNPVNAPWGHGAFEGYLKEGLAEGKAWDATELIKQAHDQESVNILIDYVRLCLREHVAHPRIGGCRQLLSPEATSARTFHYMR